MRMSPDFIFCAIARAVDSVGPPAGTISQAMRGEPSLEQKSSRDDDATAPSPAMPSTALELRSVTTTSWPPRISRRAMLEPILPSPTIPIRMRSSVVFPVVLRSESTQGFANRLGQLGQAGVHVFTDMHLDRPPPPVFEDLKISPRLRRFHHA